MPRNLIAPRSRSANNWFTYQDPFACICRANPIVENTQRDPTSPWKTSYGEWRLRTYDQKIYGSASDEDLIAGKWYEIGTNSDLRECECPSLYPLPPASPGFEAEYVGFQHAVSAM